jgi:hypothetical protein
MMNTAVLGLSELNCYETYNKLGYSMHTANKSIVADRLRLG